MALAKGDDNTSLEASHRRNRESTRRGRRGSVNAGAPPQLMTFAAATRTGSEGHRKAGLTADRGCGNPHRMGVARHLDDRAPTDWERETRFELATSCLEGRRSTTELLPRASIVSRQSRSG